MSDYGGQFCQHVSGTCLNEYVTTQVLRALEPAALDLSLTAAAHLEQDRTEFDPLWQQRLERAQFEANRARRHYQLVEPENRLVTRQLPQDWEAALQAHHTLREDYQRFCQRLEQLTQANLTTYEIIDCLHQDGFHPPKRRQTFNPEMVQTLIRRLGLTARSAASAKAPLPPSERS